MATTGEIAFTAASTANDAGSGHIDEPWVNPTNALDSNDTYAAVTAATFDTGDQTAILRTYNASAALTAAIPSTATIDGVIIRINGYSDHATLVSFDLVQLLDAAGALSGTNLAATPVSMGVDTAAIFTFGSSTEKWGLGAGLTRALLIDTEFGVGIGVLASTNNSQAFIDYVTIEVFYTVPSSTTAVAEVSLAAGSEPATRTAHSLKIRARTTAGAGTMRMALYEGSTNITDTAPGYLETSALTTSLADYTLAIADADAATIGSYADLGVRFWGYAAGGGAIVFEVDQIWLEMPAEAPAAEYVPRYGFVQYADPGIL